MMIEACGGASLLVHLEAEELRGYGVSFRRMGLRDGATRVMLRDLMTMMTHMGLRGENDRVSVDCAPTTGGGCALLLALSVDESSGEAGGEGDTSSPEREYRFDSSDDVIAAALAGALPGGRVSIGREGAGWRLRLHSVRPLRDDLLREFCQPIE